MSGKTANSVKSGSSARKPVREMLERGEDRRVMRTRDRLGNALVTLMKEKPWPEITVQQVLDRAKVSRSTFYAHYSDKNDLFISDVEDFFAMFARALARQKEDSRRVLAVRELCAHLVDVREFVSALHEAGKMDDVWELGRGHFARAIEQRLRSLKQVDANDRARPEASIDREPESRAYMLAGALVSLIVWWMDRGMKETPAEIDHIYHELVWAGAGKPSLGVRSGFRSVARENRKEL